MGLLQEKVENQNKRIEVLEYSNLDLKQQNNNQAQIIRMLEANQQRLKQEMNDSLYALRVSEEQIRKSKQEAMKNQQKKEPTLEETYEKMLETYKIMSAQYHKGK